MHRIGLILTLAATFLKAESPASFLVNEQGFSGFGRTQAAQALQPGTFHFTATENDSWNRTELSSTKAILSVGLGKGWDLGMVLPFYSETLDTTKDILGSILWGNFGIGAKRTLSTSHPSLTYAPFARIDFPTSTTSGHMPKTLAFIPSSGRYPNPHTTANGLSSLTGLVGIAATLDLAALKKSPPLSIHCNIQGSGPIIDIDAGALGTYGVSLGLELPATRTLRLESEMSHERLFRHPYRLLASPGGASTVSLGTGWRPVEHFSVQLGVLFAPPVWNTAFPVSEATESADPAGFRIHTSSAGYIKIRVGDFRFMR